MTRYGNLKTVKEIAAEIGRSRSYVHKAKKAMLQAGIPWPCQMFDIDAFISWCAATNFRTNNKKAVE